MDLTRGIEVIVARSLGNRNSLTAGSGRDYYYLSAGTTADIPLKTAGKVASIQGTRVMIELANGKRIPFHMDELQPLCGEREKNEDGVFDALPTTPAELLAQKTPLFVINERLYWPAPGTEEPKNVSGYFYRTSHSNEARAPLMQGMRLRPLQRVYLHQQDARIRTLETTFLDHLERLEGKRLDAKPAEIRLTAFALNEVLPLFDDALPEQDIGEALGIEVRAAHEETTTEHLKGSATNPYVEKILKQIRAEEIDSGRASSRLSELFGGTRHEIAAFPQAYTPTSILGSALQGRNAAFIDGNMYVLARRFDGEKTLRLELEQQPYSFFFIGDADGLWRRHQRILDKTLRIRALERGARMGWGLAREDKRIAKIAARKTYEEKNAGFALRSRYNPDLDDNSNYQGGRACFIWAHVPEHAMVNPSSGTYYRFSATKAAVPVFLTNEGALSWDPPRILQRSYAHPFVFDDGRICLGNYNYGKLTRMEPAQGVAQLLAVTKRTLLSGYTSSRVGPARSFDSLSGNRISLERLRQLQIPVTNECMKGSTEGMLHGNR